jgi:putative two-component system response regulator
MSLAKGACVPGLRRSRRRPIGTSPGGERRASPPPQEPVAPAPGSDPRELEELVAERTASLRRANRSLTAMGESLTRSRAETVRRLAGAIAARNGEAGAHSERMGTVCTALATRLGLDPQRCALIGTAGALHDVGKLAIPDAILDKPGPLTPQERRVIETHAEIGHRMLAGSGEPLLDLAALMARTHHERIDGSGYPDRLRADRIPREGRIAAVADVFDALTHDRVFRPAIAVDEALRIIGDGRGTRFDPEVVDALVACVEAPSRGPTARLRVAPGGGAAR